MTIPRKRFINFSRARQKERRARDTTAGQRPYFDLVICTRQTTLKDRRLIFYLRFIRRNNISLSSVKTELRLTLYD